MVKNLSVQETQIQSLVQEDPLEKEMTTAPVFLLGKSHGQRSLVGHKGVRHDLVTKQHQCYISF